MTRPLFLLTTVAALALGGASLAQESGSGAAQTTGDAASTLDTGEPVNDEGAQSSGNGAPQDKTYVRATHGDWQVQCLKVESGEEPCQMYQLLKDDNGVSVAEVSLFKVPGNAQVAAGGTIIVPLETLLTKKLTIQVDTRQAKRYEYSFCTRVGCYSRVGFTEDDIGAFKRGNVAKLSIVPAAAPDQTATVNMSLTGFTAAFDELAAPKQ